MKLKKRQREAVLKWIAEGLESDEINQRASKHKPPFSVSRQQVDHYRKSRGINLKKIIASGEMEALTSGLALKESRVALLQAVAGRLVSDLFQHDLFWLDQVKGIGSKDDYERVEYEEFNTAEVAQLRGVLDDIAMEVGGRVRKIAPTDPEGEKPYAPEETDRAISALADALREAVSGEGGE